MLAFDASSMIHAWDSYPQRLFPPLWKWIVEKVETGEFVVSEVAFQEIKDKVPECAQLLKNHEIKQLKVTSKIAQESVLIKKRLGIVNEKYHSEGVGENDILIIATAKVKEIALVTEEAKQAVQPKENRKLKIPGVCKLPDVNVKCMNFLEVIGQSDVIFG